MLSSSIADRYLVDSEVWIGAVKVICFKAKIDYDREEEEKNPLGIQYEIASAVTLPFNNDSFDFTTSFMCLMDIPELELALAESYRVTRPGGFFQFSITHPCFDTPHRVNKKDAQGRTYAIEVAKYFTPVRGHVDEWIFGAVPPPLKHTLPRFKTPKFSRTLSHWVNSLVATGYLIEMFHEPCPSDETVKQQPRLQDSQQVAYFLHIRCRKPG